MIGEHLWGIAGGHAGGSIRIEGLLYAIISDIHANLDALETVLDAVDARGADQIVCLGDVVGYNANPNECADLIRQREIPTICGNHDAVACGLDEPIGFNPVAMAAAMWTRDNLSEENLKWLRELPDSRVFDDFLAAHGSPTDRDRYLFCWEDIAPHVSALEAHNLSLCFFGHTHSAGIFAEDGLYSVDDNGRFQLGAEKTFFINPGSVGQPRDGDPRAAFGYYDSDTREYEQVRLDYPVKQAATRITENGLPEFLADRLFLGR